MIEIRIEDSSFEQDIRPLVRAMLREEKLKVKIVSYESPENVCFSEEEGCLVLAVRHEEEGIEIWLKDEKGDVHFGKKDLTSRKLDRKFYKNELKKVLYQVLRKYTKKELPWGTLTGIRPTKIALDFIEEGKTDLEIRDFYKEQYLTGEEKTDLSIEIARKENALLEEMDYKNGYSLYIGIPFCPTTCLYCSFTSYPIGMHKKNVKPYLEALFKEIDFVAEIFPNKRLNTIYIGGGTPTSITAEDLNYLFDYMHKRLPMAGVKEFTVEAGRPDSITREKLKEMKRAGVHRMSINPQTMVDRTLNLIGRRHDAAQVREAFSRSREEGFDNINMDLIVGLPGEGLKEVKYTLSEIEKLNPDDITVHALAIKRAANLKLKLEELSDIMPADITKMQELTYLYAREHAYEPYYLYRQKNISDNLENVGYARKGKEGLYNILIMEEKQPIIGLGAGSSSKFVFRDGKRIERTENVKFVLDYIERIDEMIDRKKKFLEEFGDLL